MNIKRAKQEIERAVKVYLEKDDVGEYCIPTVHQRPILLIGPPGIGKTAIMEQITSECGIALVSYTITHHTRQSAVGLPFIERKRYDGTEYAVTEYTMSEIVAAVYDKMEATGCREGILFIDEINCVSETLMPTMLQFLQRKTFGNHHVPKGWIIVAAGNPPEYNRSVREFDVVTLDRVKKIDVEEDFSVWKEYAYQNGIHGSVLAYLEIKKQNFYQIQTTVDGKIFVTARGWEDLSRVLHVYEKKEMPVDEQLIIQYLQHPKIAKDFANYYDLYQKYHRDYQIEEILEGSIRQSAIFKLRQGRFDEKISVIGLLLAKLSEAFLEWNRMELYVMDLFEALKKIKTQFERAKGNVTDILEAEITWYEELTKQMAAASMIEKRRYLSRIHVAHTLRQDQKSMERDGGRTAEEAFSLMKEQFETENKTWEGQTQMTSLWLEHAFSFVEEVFGDSQEMVIFVTELSMNYFAVQFISENGCDAYHRYNKSLLFAERQKDILKEIADIKEQMKSQEEI